VTEGHETAHLNRCTGDLMRDRRTSMLAVVSLTPAQTSVGTNERRGFVLVGHGVDQLFHFRLG
jgi:hypothetical protein